MRSPSLHARRLALAAALVLAASACDSTPSGTGGPELSPAEWLQANAHEISVDPADTDFSDLQPLKAAIGDARVVMLGEQSHGDGTTFLAKARLIAFLHQEMGFDVLAWESGLYDVRQAWEQVRAGRDVLAAGRGAVFGIWTRAAEVLPTFDYVQSTVGTARPLEMAGFDNQFSGSIAVDSAAAHLEAFARRIGSAVPDDPEWPAAAATLRDLARGLHWSSKPAEVEQERLLRLLEALHDQALAAAPADREALWWGQTLESIQSFARMVWAASPQTQAEDNNPRDAQMARNLVWLANTWYPGRKIIVWAATSHIARNTAHLSDIYTIRPYARGWTVHMGAEAYEELGPQMYAIGFTAATGSHAPYWGGAIDLLPPLTRSLEARFVEAGFENAFLDLRTLPEGGEWLHDVFSRPMGYGDMQGDWPTVLDAMVYTHRMSPATRALR